MLFPVFLSLFYAAIVGLLLNENGFAIVDLLELSVFTLVDFLRSGFFSSPRTLFTRGGTTSFWGGYTGFTLEVLKVAVLGGDLECDM